MLAFLQQLRIPVKRKVIQDGVVFTEAHVVRQAWTGQGDGHVMHQLVIPIHHPVVHVRRVFGVVEKKHLAGGLVHFHVGRDAVQRRPGWNSQLLQREGVHAVAFATLVIRGECLAGMHHHIGAGGVFDGPMRAPTGSAGEGRVFHQTGPQAFSCLHFGAEPFGLHKAVAVGNFAVFETDHVHHAIAVKRVVAPDGLVHRVLRVAQINTVNIFRNFAFQNGHLGGVNFFQQRSPGPLKVGVVAGLNVTVKASDELGGHDQSWVKKLMRMKRNLPGQ